MLLVTKGIVTTQYPSCWFSLSISTELKLIAYGKTLMQSIQGRELLYGSQGVKNRTAELNSAIDQLEKKVNK